MYHMRDAIRKALCFSELVRALDGGVYAFVRWLNEWTEEERNQAQKDLAVLVELERLTHKGLIDRD